MENKQTAVEWLEQEFNDTFYVAQSSEIAKRFERIFEQAKQMEKEQMCKFVYKCNNHYKVNGDFKIEQYYNNTYGKDKSNN